MKRLVIIIGSFLYLAFPLLATHNRAGEITLRQLDDLTYEITITTFTYTLSQADRNRLEVQWGDNTYSYADRKSITKLPNFYQKNIYITQHTFPGPGTYSIVVQDPNRNLGVKNIPNSVNVIFSIKTTITINPILGSNSTPVLLNPPIDRAALGQIFIHNPAAYDPDGDSISYRLTVCTEQDGKPIDGYTLPPYSDTLFVDAFTGDLTWITPVDTGIYNIAMDVEEWRQGVKIGNIARDMQIEVYNTDNNAPAQTGSRSVCIPAGTVLTFNIIATDEDLDSILQSASGGPFVVETNPATFTVDQATARRGYSRALFEWKTNCSHVRDQYYTTIFKAEDNNPVISLVDIINASIKVMGPPPGMPALIPGSNSITVTWSPDTCTNVTGYHVYRRIGPAGYVPDSCTSGVPPETGYVKIGTLNSRTDTIFFDDAKGSGLEQGNEYCYVIASIYPDGTLSFPSPEACSPLVAGSPSLIEVSVTEHSANGIIRVAWVRPEGLDTIPAPGPYEYIIYRSNNLLGQDPMQIGTINTTNLDDTVYIDSDVDTRTFPYSYRVELYNNEPGKRFMIGTPENASSLYPRLRGEDNRVVMEMVKSVPWINYDYTIFRLNNSSGEYDSIGFTTETEFVDDGLANNVEYCYRVTSTGWRILDGQLYENANFSHINCTMPVDSFPPCPPSINAYSLCDSGYNHVFWWITDDPCYEDVTGYRLYFSPTSGGEFTRIAEFFHRNDTSTNHTPEQSLTGCYYVTAIDSFQNESVPSVRVCLDECSNYVLPNVFSPNNDGINDLYIPLRTAYVERVHMKIFNRWGLLVFETEDPDINWDGKISGTGNLVSSGVYYYICDVYEYRLSGLEAYALTGFIYVYSGDENDVFIEK
ncbi:MAG: gliding motility-associated C-terminal domain-containing protein [Bacteroidales bacterium]|nr:gliding motility-associated C-terminal domain-containing protein [Bacteroidales bacterium]MBN2697239.1 gliding motility-associated C-terminal domain-containing protein [Bacteroidales bacterium]